VASLPPSAVAAVVAEELAARYGRLRLRRCGGRPVGFLVAFEGLDGSGVSTQSRILAEVLRRLVEGGDYRVARTKEPTGGPVGYLLWMTLKGYLPGLRRPDILALLFTADRLFHLYEDAAVAGGAARGVMDAVAKGFIVVSDRYKYSTLAYQGTGLPDAPELPWETLWQLALLAPPPHIAVFIDVDPAEALKRIVLERDETHLYETPRRLAAVRDAFHRVAKHLAENPEWPLIGPTGDPETPPWQAYTPATACIYQGGRWPHVALVQEEDVETTARKIAEETVRTAINTQLLLPE